MVYCSVWLQQLFSEWAAIPFVSAPTSFHPMSCSVPLCPITTPERGAPSVGEEIDPDGPVSRRPPGHDGVVPGSELTDTVSPVVANYFEVSGRDYQFQWLVDGYLGFSADSL